MGYGKAQGFTLMEAMIVVMLLGILAVLAYPSFKDTIERNRASAAQAELNKAMSYGRSEAISRNRDIGICPQSAAGDACGSAADWANGFLVYVDKNRNSAYDPPGDPVNPQPGEDEIIQHYYVKQPVLITNNANIANFIWKAGGLKLDGSVNTTITIIPTSDPKEDRNKKECTVINTGRMLCP